MEKLLKEVCAWCGHVIRDGVDPVSHGLCDRCLEKMKMEANDDSRIQVNRS